ncbi:EmrB/QacA subfamily drug resistance transporter [Thermolongibacillus altinsuensis]|uniref:EmrB/QacA subfamily drug resistance transporter n=1 Tax=Thermolongibacillus altinsuensis TaxID=575256 RepID=A0A4V2QAE9_9BACL|nr:MDR family MFS transporter [Thermolongibacillus altinsuensis]TCL51157.1 EmrB/QacA subfamily drug resistance transporter [Thermolongibacillus altinsuensis]GMB08775.1 MFS transporter [Thermolongibacillus altinsuensis]
MNDQQVSAALSVNQEQSRRGILITGLLVAMLFGALDGTIVGTALPRIVGELGGLGMMAWLTTAYMLSSTAVVPIAGKLADLLGRKSVYVSGLIIFIVGSALCGMADSMNQLIVFRAIQGIGGGVMMPMAMIVIGDIFTGEQRAKWQGVFGGVFGLASILGPQIGGWIVDSLNWRWVFYINLPVGMLAVVLIAIGLQNHRVAGPVKLDLGGMFTMVAGVVSLLLALTFGGDKYAWMSWQILSLFASSVLFFALFVMIERKAEEPILPIHLLKNKTFVVLNSVGFFMSVGMFGAIMFVPLFMQGIIGMSPSESGTMMFPMMFALIIASMIGGRLVQKIGVRRQIIGGMILVGLGFFLLSTMDVDTKKLTAMGFMAVLGFGLGFVTPVITLALQEAFPKSQLGVVTSSSQFFRQIGGTFGATILGAVMNHHSKDLLNEKFVPLLEKMPPQAHEMMGAFKQMIESNPQGVYSMILNPDTLKKIPQAMQQMFVPVLKQTLVEALSNVFLYGLIFVAIGFLLAFFIGNIAISRSGRKPSSIE